MGSRASNSAARGRARRTGLFQEYVRDLNRRGVLLAVCSKNDPANAVLPFQRHPEMVLKEADIAVFRANWEPKEVNLRAIAAAINIGTDALVFVDDNPAERARIRQTMPEVEVIELPAEPQPDSARRCTMPCASKRRLSPKKTCCATNRFAPTRSATNWRPPRPRPRPICEAWACVWSCSPSTA